jgi:hypothetical protein
MFSMIVLVKVLQRNKTNKVCIHTHRYTQHIHKNDLKKLTHTVMEIGKSKICMVD